MTVFPQLMRPAWRIGEALVLFARMRRLLRLLRRDAFRQRTRPAEPVLLPPGLESRTHHREKRDAQQPAREQVSFVRAVRFTQSLPDAARIEEFTAAARRGESHARAE